MTVDGHNISALATLTDIPVNEGFYGGLLIIRVKKYLPVGSFETTFEVKKQVCSLMTLGK